MIRFLKRTPPVVEPPPEPSRTPVEEIAYRHGEVYGAQAGLLAIDAPLTIIDGGMHHGQSAEKYMLAFPACRIVGFEPEAANFQASQARLAPFGDRVRFFPLGL